jgi:tRNA(fMet)-specific endonuclease VapC
MNLYMLHTDTCSYIFRKRPARVLAHFRRLAMEQICISVVTYAELLYGVERSSSKRINRPIVDDFVRHLDVIGWDESAAEQYGRIRADLEAEGKPIGAMDMMIAAHAKSIKAVLITNNQRHFARIKRLKIEDWV